MVFDVTIRNAGGRQEVVQVEASDRSGVFAELKRRGISALRVEESDGRRKPALRGSASHRRPNSAVRGLFAGMLVVAGAVAAFFFFMRTPAEKDEAVPRKSGPRVVQAKAASSPAVRGDAPKSARQIASELNEKAREFVKSPMTNKVQWIVPPLDPDDPDNALRTRVVQELGSLLSVEPGEPMPPFPYSFLLEDDLKEMAANGEDVGKIDNGNKAFLESLKKWKIVAKETDDDKRLEHKSKLIQAQCELLDGIDEGISVNDSIRAAYEFRKRAYELRSTIVSTLADLYEKDGDKEGALRQIADMNKRLAEEGIKTIAVGEVIEDSENPEERP